MRLLWTSNHNAFRALMLVLKIVSSWTFLFLKTFWPRQAKAMVLLSSSGFMEEDTLVCCCLLSFIQTSNFLLGGNKNNNPAGLIAASGNSSNGDVIYVSLNYRLGAFGWQSGPSFQAEGGTANVGLYDQRFALEWVQ
ncbi:MAG: hypothetical protein EOO38_16510, partial [Cytophagaceae bacterium]